MVFSSLSFLFLYLPILVILYYAAPNRTWRNGVLLVGSLLFYAWGEPRLIIIMIFSSVAAFLGGRCMDRSRLQGKTQAEKIAFTITVILILGALVVFKYSDFVLANVNRLFNTEIPLPHLRLPIGISFYTFQTLSYVIDLHRGKVSVQKDYRKLLLYICLFPQLIAGPIVRYATVENELLNRQENRAEVSDGIRRFAIGLAKKVLIANGVARFAEIVYAGDPANYGTVMYWLAALAYTLQIYFDFSGYSDMAIGLGWIFGFHFLENFDHPYTALSVTDFWRKWHISLSSWFRDYVYIPLGGNRVSTPRWAWNLFVVWALTGLWHGASWNFVIWGLYYGTLLVLEKLFLSNALQALPKGIRWLITFIIVNIGWVIFNLTNISQMRFALSRMFSVVPTDFITVVSSNTGILEGAFYLPLGLICMLPVGAVLKRRFRFFSQAAVQDIWTIVLLALCVIWLFSSKYNPFIYFRF
ncbi:MAG: MBOAT family protein [Lachnospiraceae bacterium]|nr:MBOAT family protein [Lachnospiraceae bacterium]